MNKRTEERIQREAKKAAGDAIKRMAPSILEGRRRDFIYGFKWGYIRGRDYELTKEQIEAMAEKDSREAFPDNFFDIVGKDK